MIEAARVLKDPDALKRMLSRRGFEYPVDLLVQALRARAEHSGLVSSLRAELNKGSKAVGQMRRLGKMEEAGDAQKLLALMKDKIGEADTALKEVNKQVDDLLLQLPNWLDRLVPAGVDEGDNFVVEQQPIVELPFEAQDHYTLGTRLGVLDFERASKLSGSRFAVMYGGAAKLNRALMMWLLDQNTAAGYTEATVPFIVNADTMQGTGQLPKFADDLFPVGDRYLIPTAEVPLTNLHAQETLTRLPVRYTAHTPCFRAEAGSHGRDTRGLIRQHQFEKVELVQFVRPEHSETALDAMVVHVGALLDALGLTHRVVALCAGDVGFSSAITYDFEVWLPGMREWREISSVSCFKDFQARRAGIKYKIKKNKGYVHTLNGSALPLGRTIVAIFEQYQQADGSITIPDELRPYMGGADTIRKV